MPKPAPITAAELHRTLTDLGIDIREGNSARCVALIDGTEVAIPRRSRRKDIVPHHTLRDIAHAGGFPSYSEFLASMLDRAPIKAGKPSAPAPVQTGPTKRDVRDLCATLRKRLVLLDRWLLNGTHDPDTYKKVMGAVSGALGELRHWPPTDTVMWESPDDHGYRPSTPDPVTTGVARATGLTAITVRRRSTMTRWQHDEAEQKAAQP